MVGLMVTEEEEDDSVPSQQALQPFQEGLVTYVPDIAEECELWGGCWEIER